MRALTITALACAILQFEQAAYADPLALDYTVSATGTAYEYHYDFKLLLDNHDNSWRPGERWGWLVFGDVPSVFTSGTPSPLDAFVGESYGPGNPFDSIGLSHGGHNGPNLAPVQVSRAYVYWAPTAVGQYFTWSGDAPNILTSGLKFSTLLYDSNEPFANFDTAHYLGSDPSAIYGTPLPSVPLAVLILLACHVAIKRLRALVAPAAAGEPAH